MFKTLRGLKRPTRASGVSGARSSATKLIRRAYRRTEKTLVRVMVLFAHPVETSFGASLHAKVVETLRARGHEVDDCDLNAEGFDPVMTRQDRLDYYDVPGNRRRVGPYVDRLLKSDALIFSFPVWNMGFPAILKGFVDKVFLPGVSFNLKDDEIGRASCRERV